ncbi:hypothetical protein ACIQ7Q_09355 [Streptomyces sp. NPDC096176]|uniref:hypothetical protein n=1 Tax=Streptomyces sp. NPDC096176 TaxID=3366079 RepID=UPI0038243883
MGTHTESWSSTQIPGLEVRKDGAGLVAMRLWGWEGVLPLSLIRTTSALSTDVAPAGHTTTLPNGDERRSTDSSQ